MSHLKGEVFTFKNQYPIKKKIILTREIIPTGYFENLLGLELYLQ